MPGGYYKETRTPCDPAKLGLPTPRNSDLGQKQQRSVGRILQKKQKNYDDQQVQKLQAENATLKAINGRYLRRISSACTSLDQVGGTLDTALQNRERDAIYRILNISRSGVEDIYSTLGC